VTVPVCPYDDTPLVWTFERPGAEYHCLRCGTWIGVLSAFDAANTPERDGLADHVSDLFAQGHRGPVDLAQLVAPAIAPVTGETIKCDGCGKDSGRTVEQGKPSVWYQRRPREGGTQTACSRACIDTIAATTGATRVVLPW
jgi:hypothetical protein